MDFEPSARTQELHDRLADFIRDRVDPADAVYREQVPASGDPHFHPPVMEELKAEARERGLWNLFLPDDELGAGLDHPRLRATVRADGCVAAVAGGHQLLGPRHRQHGAAGQVRHPLPT